MSEEDEKNAMRSPDFEDAALKWKNAQAKREAVKALNRAIASRDSAMKKLSAPS